MDGSCNEICDQGQDDHLTAQTDYNCFWLSKNMMKPCSKLIVLIFLPIKLLSKN